jgi:hypothetical protein
VYGRRNGISATRLIVRGRPAAILEQALKPDAWNVVTRKTGHEGANRCDFLPSTDYHVQTKHHVCCGRVDDNLSFVCI